MRLETIHIFSHKFQFTAPDPHLPFACIAHSTFATFCYAKFLQMHFIFLIWTLTWFLSFFFRYYTLKIWQSDWPGAFWSITWEPEFWQKGFTAKVVPNFKKTNERISSKTGFRQMYRHMDTWMDKHEFRGPSDWIHGSKNSFWWMVIYLRW